MNRISYLLALAVLTAATTAAQPPCGSWLPGFDYHDGANGEIVSSLVVHEESGRSLFVSGAISRVEDVPVRGIARWDGRRWHAFGAQTGFNGGGPLALYNGQLVSTDTQTVFRWLGDAWEPLGTISHSSSGGFSISAITEFRGELIIAGRFHSVAGEPLHHIARWNGSIWRPLGTEEAEGLFGSAWTLAVFNDDLIVGGSFSLAGDVPVSNIARWDGAAWHSLGSGLNNVPTALLVHDGWLYVTGHFTVAGGQPAGRFARWNGEGWEGLDPQSAGNEFSIGRLGTYAGHIVTTRFLRPGSPTFHQEISIWDGDSWTQLSDKEFDNLPTAFSEYNGDLIVAGDFTVIGDRTIHRIARWDGKTWNSFGQPRGNALEDSGASALLEYDGRLVAGGGFDFAGEERVNRIALWDGVEWQPFAGVNSVGVAGNFGGYVNALAIFEGDLIIGGNFTSAGGLVVSNIARWNGDTWSDIGGGLNSGVADLCLYQGDLVAAGPFTQAGVTPVTQIARWDGTRWHPLGAGLGVPGIGIDYVFDVEEYASQLYAGGTFRNAGDITVNSIARWNGSEWLRLGEGRHNGVAGDVRALIVHEGLLYVGGWFTDAGGSPAGHVATWNGSAWSSFPSFGAAVQGFAVYNGALVALSAGARLWDGDTWQHFLDGQGLGANASPVAAAEYRGDLYFGGNFTAAGPLPSRGIAVWSCNRADMNCDGRVSLSDIRGFVTALMSADDSAVTHPSCSADTNNDGRIDHLDIDSFVERLLER